MINIIRDQTPAEAIAKVFAGCPPINLLPPMGDSAWQAVRDNPVAAELAEPIRERAMNELDEPMPVLTDELYEDFFKTGQRLPFEGRWFDRRRRVARAAVAALLEDDANKRDVLLRSLFGKFEETLAEVSWTFPSHVWNNPTGKDPMNMDLFAAETANLCGELLNLFGAVFPPAMREQTLARLKTQFFDNYLAKPPHWTLISNNWNAVCHQGVLGAALSVCDDPQLLGRLFQTAATHLKTFLSGFAADGGSSEGPGYWGYGFGWFMELNHQLEARTRGQLSLVEGDAHVRAIASFGPRMTLTNGFVVNFSDNNARSTPGPATLQYLAERFDDPFIRAHAALAWQRTAADGLNLDEQRGDLFKYSRLLLRCPTALGPPATLPATDLYLPDLGVAVVRFNDARGNTWEFAAKAGHNDEHHNHNDAGAYLLNLNGHRLLTDIGQPEYTKAFFSNKRYESIAARSIGHPLPLINGVEQAAGREFAAKTISQEFSPTAVRLKFDLTAAYPPSAGCRRCERTIEIQKADGKITVTDSFELDKVDSLETAVITESPVEQGADGAVISAHDLSLRITTSADTAVAEVQHHDYSNHAGRPAHINRIVLRPAVLKPKTVLAYTIELM